MPMKIPVITTLTAATLAWSAASSLSQPSPGPPSSVTANNGLAGDDQTRFYHLPEGSEVYPLTWMRALKDGTSGRPFMEGLERFGLIADATGPHNPEGLPIGLTVDATRDLRFAGTRMVGVNCAACHVSEWTRNGHKIARIDGAPNLFDLSRFYGDLAKSTVATFTDIRELWAFLGRLRQSPGGRNEVAAADTTAALTRAYPSFESLRAAPPAEKAFAQELQSLYWEELARPVEPLGDGVAIQGGPESSAASPSVASPEVFESQARKVLAAPRGEAAAAATSGTEAARAEGIRKAFADFVTTVRILRARAQFLLSLATAKDLASTPPGYGRVDAFGGARNLLFPRDARPLTAPIGYPHLWDIGRTSWYHWDGSTTSLLERNVGQALGLGAVFDRATFVSTVNVANIEELERLAARITPPAWPAAALGSPEPARARRGAAVFAARCAQCHADSPPGQALPDRLYPLDAVGTDPARARNFALPVRTTAFDAAFSPVLKQVIRAAGGTPSARSEWRVTQQYAGRPLVAVWATAPYLHNGSVPTIDDLLRPAAERPRSFPICDREYDPVKLGLAGTGADPACVFDTTLAGNGNGGHSGPTFGTDLSIAQRRDLIEFLKGR
jgi:mono/diheme cytochrome c family protein